MLNVSGFACSAQVMLKDYALDQLMTSSLQDLAQSLPMVPQKVLQVVWYTYINWEIFTIKVFLQLVSKCRKFSHDNNSML